MADVLLFDLDETLVVEEPAAVAAFEATARRAAIAYELEVVALAVAARRRARELWRAAPTYDYCQRVGSSSWEGLRCRHGGDGHETRALREWSPIYRREAWRLPPPTRPSQCARGHGTRSAARRARCLT